MRKKAYTNIKISKNCHQQLSDLAVRKDVSIRMLIESIPRIPLDVFKEKLNEVKEAKLKHQMETSNMPPGLASKYFRKLQSAKLKENE